MHFFPIRFIFTLSRESIHMESACCRWTTKYQEEPTKILCTIWSLPQCLGQRTGNEPELKQPHSTAAETSYSAQHSWAPKIPDGKCGSDHAPLHSRDLSVLVLFFYVPFLSETNSVNQIKQPWLETSLWYPITTKKELRSFKLWGHQSVTCSPPQLPYPLSFLVPHLLFSTGLIPFHRHCLPCGYLDIWDLTVKALP